MVEVLQSWVTITSVEVSVTEQCQEDSELE